MDWNTVLEQGATVLGSGGSAFLGAYLRFKQRLKDCEDALKLLAIEVPALRVRVEKLHEQVAGLGAGWRLEFDQFKTDFERELKHQQDLDNLREKERGSRPDQFEDVRRELRQLHLDVEKLKERGGRYVRSDAFVAFTKAQEDQWKEMARTLGRLEGMLK